MTPVGVPPTTCLGLAPGHLGPRWTLVSGFPVAGREPGPRAHRDPGVGKQETSPISVTKTAPRALRDELFPHEQGDEPPGLEIVSEPAEEFLPVEEDGAGCTPSTPADRDPRFLRT